MPKAIEDCVKKINGTNPRTKKPYTQQEKWAICTAAHKNKKGNASEDLTKEEIALAEEEFDKKMNACHQRMMKSGRAKNMEEAHQICSKELAKANYDLSKLEFFLDLDLIKRI